MASLEVESVCLLKGHGSTSLGLQFLIFKLTPQHRLHDATLHETPTSSTLTATKYQMHTFPDSCFLQPAARTEDSGPRDTPLLRPQRPKVFTQ